MSYLLAALLLLQPAGARHSIEFTSDTLPEVAKNVAEGKALLVDVRSEEEWKQGCIVGAVFVPIDSLRKFSLDRQKVATILPKKKVLYTYCAVGMRAKAAAAILEREGYTVRPLKAGYEDLVEHGFKAEIPTEPVEASAPR